jgi:hypothetical protein
LCTQSTHTVIRGIWKRSKRIPSLDSAREPTNKQCLSPMVSPAFACPCVCRARRASETHRRCHVCTARQPTTSHAPSLPTHAASNSTHLCCSRTHSRKCTRRGGAVDRPNGINEPAAIRRSPSSPPRQVPHHPSSPSPRPTDISCCAGKRASSCMPCWHILLHRAPCPSSPGPTPYTQ